MQNKVLFGESKPLNKLTPINIFATIGASNHSATDRQVDDYYATHPSAVEELLKYETFNHNVWECCCGQGHISEVLKNHNYEVKSTDLVDRGYGESNVNFLLQTEPFDGDIITNPPYKFATAMVYQALKLTKDKVAMLLRLQFLEGMERRALFDEYPPKFVYIFSKRTNTARNGDFEKYPSSVIAFAWYVWQKDYKGDTVIKWIN